MGRTRKRQTTVVARKIWIAQNGPIPRDENNIPFDIHHSDFNPNNNAPDNLKALSLSDHYQVHWENGDYGAAWCIALRMRLSPEQRLEKYQLIANKLKGRKFPPEFGDAVRARRTGAKATAEARLNMSLAHIGKKPTAETRAKMSASQRGRVRSPESSAQTVATRRARGNYCHSEATRKLISQIQIGKSRWPNGRSPESIEKMKATKRLRREMRDGCLEQPFC